MRSLQLRWTVAAIFAAVTAAAGTPQFADLGVTMTAPEQSAADSDVPYDITVANGGPDAAQAAEWRETLPPGTTFVSVIQTAGPTFDCVTPVVGGTGIVRCTVVSLASGGVASFTLVLHIAAGTAPGTFITNIVTVETETPDPNVENDSATANTQVPAPPTADVRVEKQGPSVAQSGTDVTYHLVVSASAEGDAPHLSFTDTLPLDMVFVSFVQDSGPALVCSSGPTGFTCGADPFPAGATATFTLVGHIPPGTPDGTTYQNSASVSSDRDPNPENDTAVTQLCVQLDACVAGECNGNQAVVCPTAGSCENQGTCDPASGLCAPNTPKDNGTLCNDGDACSQSDTCQAGLCLGTNPVVCPLAGACQVQGICSPATGICAANTNRDDGTPCSDGDACSQSDTCQTGVCVGANPVVCPTAGQCENQGTCNPVTGLCANPPKDNGTPCDDGVACTQPDTCQAGVCQGINVCIDAGPPPPDAGVPPVVDAALPVPDGSTPPVIDAAPGTPDAEVVPTDDASPTPTVDARANTPADARGLGLSGETCGCQAAGGSPTGGLILFGLALLLLRRRRVRPGG